MKLGVYLVDGRQLQNHSQRPGIASGVSDVAFYVGYVVAQMEQRENFLGKKKNTSGTLELRASRWDTSLVKSPSMSSGAIVASAQAKEKAGADRFRLLR